MAVDYCKLVRVIQARTKCSNNEAWEAISQAFLTLDQSRSEGERVSYLLNVGSLKIAESLRDKYLDKDTGVQRLVSLELVNEVPDQRPADNSDFLKVFPEGLVREFATRLSEGSSKFTSGSASHWLRKFHNINTRSSVKELLNDTRVCAKRLQ